MRLIARVCLFAVFSASVVVAQVSTGVPPFSSIGGGPFDQVNLGNLNVHFAIPIIHKAGRGLPFIYDLSYDSSVWYPSAVSGTNVWTPVQAFGWRGATEIATGYVSWSYFDQTKTTKLGTCEYITWGGFVYHDPFGVQHQFGGKTEETIVYSGSCPIINTPNFNGTAKDGSAYTINVAGYNGVLITSPTGKQISPPANSGTGAASYIDNNGNEITTDGSGHFTDTLGTTLLTVAGNAPSPQTFTYTNPQGGTSSYTMNYQAYTIKTKFGVSGIGEYGPLSNYLVSSISLPDGTAYDFTYEQTPSSASCTPLGGTYSGFCTTGRLASVSLPTGGTITYSYTGGSNGIESDGSASGLTRILSGSGTWTYTRTLNSGTPGPGSTWTTTITDPATPTNNQAAIAFTEDSANGASSAATYNLYETLRQVYQGSVSPSNLLATTTTCYNANYASCSTAAITSPISQTDTYYQPSGGSTRLSEIQYNGSFSGSGLVSRDDEYDYGVSQGAAPGNTHLIKQTITAYASLGNGIIGAPASVTVNDWSGGTSNTIAYTSYNYDQTTATSTSGTPQHISVTGSRGNLTTLGTKASSSTTVYQTFSYYDTGTLNTSTGLSTSPSTPGPQTTFTYGTGSCGNSFATLISEPLSLTRANVWNCVGGVITQATDENSKNITINYTDANFWRPSSIIDQATNATSITYSGQTSIEAALVFNGGNSASDILTTLDEYGRPGLYQRRQTSTGSTFDTYETDYNSVGLPSRSTMPFTASAGGTSSTAPSVQTTYDALGRRLSVFDNNGGTVSYQYVKNDVLQTISGTQTFKKQFEYDGLGRLSSVCEVSTSLPGVGTCGQAQTQTGYWTKYTYDALGHLLTVTQNA